MQTLYLNLIELFLILTVRLNVLRKPLVEELMGIEQVRHYKVKQGP